MAAHSNNMLKLLSQLTGLKVEVATVSERSRIKAIIKDEVTVEQFQSTVELDTIEVSTENPNLYPRRNYESIANFMMRIGLESNHKTANRVELELTKTINGCFENTNFCTDLLESYKYVDNNQYRDVYQRLRLECPNDTIIEIWLYPFIIVRPIDYIFRKGYIAFEYGGKHMTQDIRWKEKFTIL